MPGEPHIWGFSALKEDEIRPPDPAHIRWIPADIYSEVFGMKLHRYMLLVMIVPAFISTALLKAESTGHLSGRIVLFGDASSPPVLLDSERGWVPITAIDWSDNGIPQPLENESRRWRLQTSYEHGPSSGPATVQIRLRGPKQVPTFTHPWSEGADRRADAYSNWYEDEGSLTASVNRGYIEARLIAPPRSPLKGKLYSVALEAWDIGSGPQNLGGPAGPEVELAYTRPLPTVMRGQTPPDDSTPDMEAATNFALAFVESCITGSLPDYYRAQADPVRSLDDGKAIPRYRLNPPVGIPGVADLDDYKRRFDYRLYDSETTRELFPEWFSSQRPWNPSEDSLLFMGHKDRLSGAFPSGVDYLVFLMEQNESGEWEIVARPGS